jgi:hypothetical protein
MTWDELQLRANLGLGLDEPLPLYRLCPGCGDRILTLGPHDCWVAMKEHHQEDLPQPPAERLRDVSPPAHSKLGPNSA